MREQIKSLLGRGIPAAQVADAVGCDASYVSQLLSDPDFEQEVAVLRADHAVKFVEHDAKLDELEELALKRVATLLPFATKLSEAAKVFSLLNGAKRRSEAANVQSAPAQTVTIELPAAASVKVVVSTEKQVVEIEGRSMTTMPAKTLAARLEQRNAQRLLDAQVPAMLPVSKVAAAL